MAPPPHPDRTETLAPRTTNTGVAPTLDAGDRGTREPPSIVGSSDPSDDPDRYQQVAEHGRGGLGRVVRAVDKRLGRTVAVKELLRRGDSAEARFLREALITARLEHPGIVPVHEAGRWPNGDPYYVMKLVEGRTLKELIAARATLRERLGLLPHVIAVADAVGYAHSEGVIHRDLKPSNVIVGAFGETIVVDWGLARDRKRDLPEPSEHVLAASGSGVSTVSGKVVGTPAYMSPEQARGELVDERADVYALGAVLYELLAGTPPHHDDTPQATLERVIAGPPRPLAMMAPHVPSELGTIVTKAMERLPDARYPDACALAEDLRRFTTGKLVSAHSYTAWSLLRKKLSHHRGVVAVALASAIALGAVGVESFRRVLAERNIARIERDRADIERIRGEQRERNLVLLQAETSLRKDPTATLAWLKRYELSDDDRAHVVDVIDEAVALGVARHVFRPGDWVYDAAFTPDGSTVFAAVRDGVVRGWDVRSGFEVVLGKADSAVERLVVSRDGRFVITGGVLGEVMIWPLYGGQPRRLAQVTGGKGRIRSLELSPDGAHVLATSWSGPPAIIPLDGGAPLRLGPPSSYLTAVAASDWTRQVVTTSPNQIAAVGDFDPRPLARIDRAIKHLQLSPHGDLAIIHDGSTLWSVPYAGGPLTRLVGYEAKINHVVWSPDQQTLAICGDRHEVVLVDVVSGAVRELRGHGDAIYSVQWTRDGRRLLSASDDATARVWTVGDGTALVLRGHDDDILRARFSSDELHVVTASIDGSVRVWPIAQPGSRLLVEGARIERLSLEGDRALVETSTELARWNIASGHREPVFSWAADSHGLGVGIPSPDGELALVPSADLSLEVRRRNGPSITLRGHDAVISALAFSRDSRLLYTASHDGTLRRWDLATGEGTLLFESVLPVRAIAVGRDGRVIVHLGDSTQLIRPDGRVEELGTGPKWCGLTSEIERVRDRVLMRRCDESVALIDGDRVIELSSDYYQLIKFAVSPDGSRIAGALGDRTIRLWDANTGTTLRQLRGHVDLVMDVAFSPDGTQLASASYDKTVWVWDLATERHRVLRGHALAVNNVAWRNAGELVTGSYDGTLRVWQVPSLELPAISELGTRIDRATTARVSDDRRPTTSETRTRGT